MGGPVAPAAPGRRRAVEPDEPPAARAEPRAPEARTPELAPVRDYDPRLRNTGPHPRDLAEAGQSGLPPQTTPHDRSAPTVNPVVGNAAPSRRADAQPRTAASAADPRTGEPRTASSAAGPRQRPIEPTWAAPTRALAQPFEQNRDSVPAHRPLPGVPGVPRVVLDEVEVSTQGTDAVVEVRLSADDLSAVGMASGPDFDGYVLRLAAVAAANAVDELLTGAARCFVENATVVPLGSCEVAVVVLLLAHGGWIEELSGSAVVNGDQRQAVVRATLAAVNRRLEALLP
jgi:hypothetical protein